MLMISSSLRCSSSVAAAQQSSSTTTLKLSSARLLTVEEMHWSVKMPQQMTCLMPRLCRMRRKFVPVSAEFGRLGHDDFVAHRLQARVTSCDGSSSFGSKRLFQPGIFCDSERSRPSLVWRGDAGEEAFDPVLSRQVQQFRGAGDDRVLHALVEGRPSIVAALLFGRE